MNTTNEVQNTKAVTTQEGVWVPIDQIVVLEDARPHTQEDIDSRAVSMNREGQAQAALVSKEGDKLVLVYGHGRLLSAKKLGWEKLRCDIKEGLSETQKLMLTLAENEEREEASPFFTAQLYTRIMATEHLSPEQLPDYLKKSRTTVYDYLALAKLSAGVQAMSERSDIGFCQWREIAKLQKPEDQVQLAQECAEKDYSVRELQARVKQLLNPAGSKAKEGKPAVEDTILDCHYVFDGKEVVVKPRRFRMGKESFDEYLLDIKASLTQFVTGVQCGAYQKPEGTAVAA